MDDVARSGSRRGRGLALGLFVVFLLFSWWLTAVTWIDTPSARGQGTAAAIVQWLLAPMLAGGLAAWLYRGRRTVEKRLLTCAGAGLLVSVINFAFIAIWPASAYPVEPRPDLPPIDLDIPIVFGLVGAILGALAATVYLGLTRLAGRRG